MASKRKSDGPITEDSSKKPLLESDSEQGSSHIQVSETQTEGETSNTPENLNRSEDEVMTDDDFKYYDPSDIFKDTMSNLPINMAGSKNYQLAQSFYHSRYDEENQQRTDDDRNKYYRNAGAVQLYNKDGETLYIGQEGKEYNTVSLGYTNELMKKSNYGHSERILMTMVLDDLISDGETETIKRPSDFPDSKLSGHERDYEILKNLTENADKYKKYLEEKGIIVKMWSERQSCSNNKDGGVCKMFMQQICPKGSKFGYIVNRQYKDVNEEIDVVSGEFGKLRDAYLECPKP